MATAAKGAAIESDLKYLSQWRRSAHFIESGKNDARRGRMLRLGFIEVDPILGSPWLRLSRSGKKLVRQWKQRRPEATLKGSNKATQDEDVGKKLSANRRKPDFTKGTLRWLFCMRLRELCQGRDTADVAKLLGVTGQLARKYLGGSRAPDMDDLPKIAKAFGLSDWTDLFRPKNS